MVLRSYLLDRKFQVKFSDEVSQLYDIKASVPQGSVLGPILYSKFILQKPRGYMMGRYVLKLDNTIYIKYNDITKSK